MGVGVGAAIHNWIPQEWVGAVLGSDNPFGVILATLIGIPMYADIFGTIPIAEALLAKGTHCCGGEKIKATCACGGQCGIIDIEKAGIRA